MYKRQPIVRLGNNDKVEEAAKTIKRLYLETKDIKIFDRTLDRNKGDRTQRARELAKLLKRYEDVLELREQMCIRDRYEAEQKREPEQSALRQQIALAENELPRYNELDQVRKELDARRDALKAALDQREEQKNLQDKCALLLNDAKEKMEAIKDAGREEAVLEGRLQQAESRLHAVEALGGALKEWESLSKRWEEEQQKYLAAAAKAEKLQQKYQQMNRACLLYTSRTKRHVT